MISVRCDRTHQVDSGRHGWLRALAGAPLVLASACGASLPEPSSAAASRAAAPEAPAEPPPPPLPPLSPEEAEARQAIEREVTELTAIGPRNTEHTWNLATATDHLALRLEGYGYTVARQGFMAGEEPLQNLEVEVSGKGQGEELVVVVSHYDTLKDSPGANASASGAAALLVLAKSIAGQHFTRSVRLAWLANESDEAASTAGSNAYLRALQSTKRPVVATLTLGSLGYYSVAPGTQRYPEELLYGADKRPKHGDFVALVANPSSNALLERAEQALRKGSLPVEALILPDTAPLAGVGSQARFWQAGLPGLLLTDTEEFRYPHRGGALDTVDQLDFDRLARLVAALEPLLSALAGPKAAETSAPLAEP